MRRRFAHARVGEAQAHAAEGVELSARDLAQRRGLALRRVGPAEERFEVDVHGDFQPAITAVFALREPQCAVDDAGALASLLPAAQAFTVAQATCTLPPQCR